jgi:hypothetical protein
MGRHAGDSYEARSYRYTLEKRVKQFVWNGKGVIGLIEDPQGLLKIVVPL